MKDSGVEWIGEIPINAKIIKLKSISNIINGYAFKSEMFTDDENELNVITISSFDNQKILPEKLSYSIEKKDFSKYLLQENDILIAMSGGTVGKNVLVRNIRKNMYINQRVCILRSQYYKYISYWINSDSFKEYTLLNSIGSAQPNISSTQLNEFDIPWSNEVEKVVDILDEKISIIEDIIVKTKNSIEELKKYKQSLITEVVTKGLDKNVEMKDSGIEWIGEIPKDWEMTKLRYQIIIDPSTSEINVIPEDSTFLPMEKLKNGYMDIELKGKTFENMKKYTYFAEGDITIAKVRPSFENGNIAIAKNLISKIGFGTSEIFTIRNQNKDILQEFLFYFLQNQSFIKYASSTMTGVAGLKRISSSILRDTKITVPNLNEQKQIINFLNQKTNDIETLIDKKKSLINEYESYKKSLIYEYVTGKKEAGEEVE